jgi:hypothetical protein
MRIGTSIKIAIKIAAAIRPTTRAMRTGRIGAGGAGGNGVFPVEGGLATLCIGC